MRTTAEPVEKLNPQLCNVQTASFENTPIGRFFDRLINYTHRMQAKVYYFDALLLSNTMHY